MPIPDVPQLAERVQALGLVAKPWQSSVLAPGDPLLGADDLAGLELGLVSVGDPPDRPKRMVGAAPMSVRPEDGARFAVLWTLKEPSRVDQRDVVGVDQDDVLERAVHDRVRLALPAAHDA